MVGRVPQPSRKTEKTMHWRRSVAPFKAFLPESSVVVKKTVVSLTSFELGSGE